MVLAGIDDWASLVCYYHQEREIHMRVIAAKKKATEILDISVEQLIKETRKSCRIYGGVITGNRTAIQKCINDAVVIAPEVSRDTKSIRNTKIARDTKIAKNIQTVRIVKRAVMIKHDGTGRHIAAKNIRFYPVTFIEGLYGVMGNNLKPISIMLFLLNLLKQMSVDLDKKQVLLYAIFVAETKKVRMTDENLMQCVNSYMKQYGYSEWEEEELYEVVSRLLELEIIGVTNGVYEVNDRFYFEV